MWESWRPTWHLTLSIDLLTWISIGIIYSPSTIYMYLPSLKLMGQSVLELSVAQLWFTNLTFDPDLWSTDLVINRDHLLMKDYLPIKFEAFGAKPIWVISCTGCGRRTWSLTLTFDLLAWILIGIIYASRTIYIPSFKILRQLAFLSYQLHKVWETDMTFDHDLHVWPEYQ